MFESEANIKGNSVMVRAVIVRVDHPVRDSHRKVTSESHVNMGMARRGLKCGDVAHVFNMKSMAKEEILKGRAARILIRTIDGTVGI